MRTSKYEYANKKPLSTWLNSTSSVPSTLSREERKRTEEDPSKGGQLTTQLETQRSNKWASGCAGHSRERHAWNACWRSRKRGRPSRRSPPEWRRAWSLAVAPPGATPRARVGGGLSHLARELSHHLMSRVRSVQFSMPMSRAGLQCLIFYVHG